LICLPKSGLVAVVMEAGPVANFEVLTLEFPGCARRHVSTPKARSSASIRSPARMRSCYTKIEAVYEFCKAWVV